MVFRGDYEVSSKTPCRLPIVSLLELNACLLTLAVLV